MADLIVRDATFDDAEAIAAVHVASWQAAYRHALAPEVLDAMTAADRLPAWQWRLASPPTRAAHVLVAARDGVVAGFAGTQLHEGTEVNAGELLQLYLDPRAFGSGVAQALHDSALDRLRSDGCSVALLDVEVDNARARRFYERNGWRSVPGTERDVEAWGVAMRCIDHRRDLSTS